MDSRPAMVMTIDSTVAKIGRSMKNREMFMGAPRLGRLRRRCRTAVGGAWVALTRTPGRIRANPFTTTCSPGLSPSRMMRRCPSTCRPRVTVR